MNDLSESVRRVASKTGLASVVRIDRGEDTQLSEAFGLSHRGLQVPNTERTQLARPSRSSDLVVASPDDRVERRELSCLLILRGLSGGYDDR